MQTHSFSYYDLFPDIQRFLSKGYKVKIDVYGYSMLPFIIGGRDKVVLKKKETYAQNDIVLAEIKPGFYVIHRIISIKNKRVTLMGDGNCCQTECCDQTYIIAKIITIIRNKKEIACDTFPMRRKVYLWKQLIAFRKYLLIMYRYYYHI